MTDTVNFQKRRVAVGMELFRCQGSSSPLFDYLNESVLLLKVNSIVHMLSLYRDLCVTWQ